jgi:uncharacterized membrane protein
MRVTNRSKKAFPRGTPRARAWRAVDPNGNHTIPVSIAPGRKMIVKEERIHQFFVISVLLKGAHALIECIGGIILALISNDTIVTFVNRLTQDEIVEDPNDLVAIYLRTFAKSLSVSDLHFYSLYLLSHGAIKILLVVSLLRKKMWSYPASLIVLSLFVAYQIYRFAYTYSVGLIVLTALDIIVMGLIWHEYRLMQQHRP